NGDNVKIGGNFRKLGTDTDPAGRFFGLIDLDLVRGQIRRIRIEATGQPAKSSEPYLRHIRFVNIVVLNVLEHRFEYPDLGSGIVDGLLCLGGKQSADSRHSSDDRI